MDDPISQGAQGYLGRPDLTASRFIADPFAPGERMYRTGDVARWLDNGAVEYLGRSDDQLKIRGQRIELGEIDRVMQALPDVEQAVTHACVINQAAATGGDARQLVGYLVSQSGLPLDIRSAVGYQRITPAHYNQVCRWIPAHYRRSFRRSFVKHCHHIWYGGSGTGGSAATSTVTT